MLRLKELRQVKELSQQKLADQLGISQSAVNSYENGINEPDIRMLKQFAAFFEVSIDYIVGLTDIPDPVKKDESCYSSMAEKQLIDNYRSLSKELQGVVDRLLTDMRKTMRG